MMTMRTLLSILLFVFWGCNEPMTPISSVDKFRIMAIQAEPPEVRPGGATTHRVLYADPKGKGRSINFIWLTCLGELTPSADLSQGCELIGFSAGEAGKGGDVYTVPYVPDNALANLQEGETYATATTILSACAGGEPPTAEDIAALEGFDSLDSLCQGGKHILAFKTFRISEATDENRNTNPKLSKVLFDDKKLIEVSAQNGDTGDDTDTDTETRDFNGDAGVEPDAGVDDRNHIDTSLLDAGVNDDIGSSTIGHFECKSMAKCLHGAKVKAFLTETSFETYEEEQLGKIVSQDEAPYVSWFVTGGEVSNDRSRTATPPGPFKTNWSPPLDGGEFSLWVVAHDLRGGASWKQYAIEAKTPESSK